MKRYAAKLLFQFRLVVNSDSGRRRTCEERIVVLRAVSAKRALALAKRKGIKSEYGFENSDGKPVIFEFIGVIDLLELGRECEKDEVWYEIVTRVLPSERSEQLIPSESKLCAIRNENRRAGIETTPDPVRRHTPEEPGG